jgi:DNA-directed RNA polymerase subunit RPC12/RpoP
MPEMLIHCQNCRALLNTDLETDTVEVPAFLPLQEIASMIDVSPTGYYIACPKCKEELRINKKYIGERVQCKFCHGQFLFVLTGSDVKVNAFFAVCPHCDEEVRAAEKYKNAKVACKHCGGRIQFVDG